MRPLLKLATTLVLALGMAATSFAVINSNPKLNPAPRVEKSTSKRNPNQARRHGAKKLGNKRRPSGRRGRRLTARQRREVYRKLIDIKIN
jgi:hypothetical protein